MITGTTSVRIYNSIKNTCLGIDGIKDFGLWNNQLNKLKDGAINLKKFPGIYVQFENTYNQLSVGRQEIDGTFILYICIQSLKHKDEDILNMKDYVYRQLTMDLPASGFQDFYRAFELQDTDYDNLVVFQQEYSYSYICDNTKDELNYITINPFTVAHDVHY